MTKLLTLAITAVVAISACTNARLPNDVAIWRGAVPSDSVPRTITEAEALGARYPRQSGPESVPAAIAAQAHVGNAERRCVDVGASDVARSGDFLAGNFAQLAKFWAPQPPKMWWQATHQLAQGQHARFVVRVAKLSAPDSAYVYTTPDFTRMEGRGTEDLEPAGPGGRTYIRPPARGRWLFVATVDKDWGCFVVTL